MTPTAMDQVTTPAEAAAPAADLQPSPTDGPPRPRAGAAWTSAVGRPRSWWTIALAGAILVTAFGFGLLYVDDSNNQASVRALTTQNEQLQGRTQIVENQLKTTNDNLTATLGQLAQAKAELEHPTLSIWTVSEQINGPTVWLEGNVPDTFTYHLQVTSTGPMSVSILTLQDFTAANTCISNGGYANYCMHHSGAVLSWLSVTSVNYDFHSAEGCADYVAVFTSAAKITIKPNISVTYAPASKATGSCAG